MRSVEATPAARLLIEERKSLRFRGMVHRWWRRAVPLPQAGHGPPPMPEAAIGPLTGKQVLVFVAPIDCDGDEVRALSHLLGEAGAQVGVACETPGEARDEKRRPLTVNLLAVEIDPAEWDALVFAGGAGAARVARDELVKGLAERFVALGKPVASMGQGRSVLSHLQIEGIAANDAASLRGPLSARLAGREVGSPHPHAPMPLQ